MSFVGRNKSTRTYHLAKIWVDQFKMGHPDKVWVDWFKMGRMCQPV